MRETSRFFSWCSCTGGGAVVASLAFGATLVASAPAQAECCSCLGDIDKNGFVDGADLGLLLGAWDGPGTPENEFCEDVNFDGIVDGADLGLLLGAWDGCFPFIPDTCGHPCAGPCDEAHDTPFCSDAKCCEAVCAVDPFCCSVAWDGICVSEAGDICGGGGPCPNPDHDCCSTGSVGCSDEACCNLVCGVDPFCCSVAWDSICVAEAQSMCGCEPPPVCGSGHDCCVTGGVGCSDADCCNAVCSVDPFCCSVAWDGICVSEAQSICGCTPPPACPNPSHDCCAQGTPGCSDEDCCNAVCSVDPFCCSVAWDAICVSEAQSICGCVPVNPCPNPKHDCATTGGPGCSDEDCCNTVCSADPFCCSVAWDGICVSESFFLCGEACTLSCPKGGIAEEEVCGDDTNGGCNAPPKGASNCCVANGGLGCDDETCTSIVCAADPFCCSVAWDGICAGEAQSMCDINCVGGGPQVENISCGDTICGTWFSTTALRDTDWFLLDLSSASGPTAVSISITGEIAPLVAITTPTPGCALLAIVNGPPCQAVTLDACLNPGTYFIAALPAAFIDAPCDQNYTMTLTCGGECDPFPACPNPKHDCSSTGGPGCSDDDCCQNVCSADPFCCSVAWDGICVSESFFLCGASCTLTCAPGEIAEAEPCGADTNGGCNAPGFPTEPTFCGANHCGTWFSSTTLRDTDWYFLDLSGAATPTAVDVTITAEMAPLVAITDTNCTLLAIANGPPCTPLTLSACLNPGTYFVAALPAAFIDAPCDQNYSMSVSCGGDCDPFPACPNAKHDCNSTGGPGCSDNDCCETVCSVDPFCCSVAWDGICVSEAAGFCGGGSNCCFASGGLGCDDAACTATVCGVDPFCCSVAWDGICAGEAQSMCEVCGGGGGGGNPACPNPAHDCNSTGSAGCSDEDCCNAVCAVDGFCCSVAWDGICVGEAGSICGGGGGSNCCIPNGGLGCDDAGCEAAVCGIDGFCCSVAWDSICAAEAATQCPGLCG